jgi:hypothetical protein
VQYACVLLTTFTYLLCAHEQKASGGVVDRRGNKNAAFSSSSNNSKHNGAKISMDLLSLGSRDLAIFMLTTDKSIALPLAVI